MATTTQTATEHNDARTEEAYDTFPGQTAFPTNIPTAPLLRLSLSKLHSTTRESERLFSACKDLGFFYLDLRDDTVGEQVLSEADGLFHLSRDLFALGREALDGYDYSSEGSYIGYKGFGKGVVDAKGTLDRNEFFNTSKDDFLNLSAKPHAHPKILMEKTPLLTSYMLHAHAIITHILNHLNHHLQLPTGTLSRLHDQQSQSGDHIRMIKAPPQDLSNLGPSMGAHTDFGSITLLMNRIGGLQVLLPHTSSFTYVRPLPGHCIINLGDAMVKFSNGLLRSNVHRVVSPPGDQATETRYSLVYFSRPADHVLLKRLDGAAIPQLEEGVVEEDVSSRDWIRDKAMARRTGAEAFVKVGLGKGRETARLEEEEEEDVS